MDPTIGSWPHWLSLLVSIIGGGLAWLLRRRHNRRVELNLDHVYATVTEHWEDDPQQHPVPPTLVKVVNGGTLPVRRVYVTAREPGRRRITWRLRRYRGWTSGQHISCLEAKKVLEPGECVEVELPAPRSPTFGGDEPPVILSFRDSQNRRWVRWHNGKLTRMYPSVYWFGNRLRRRRHRRQAQQRGPFPS